MSNMDYLNAFPFMNLIITIALLSMAGVPPFIGFFSKVFVLVILTSTNLYLLYPLFLILLLVGLYFYMQNVRHIHSTKPSKVSESSILSYKSTTFYIYAAINSTFLTLVGIFTLDELLLLSK